MPAQTIEKRTSFRKITLTFVSVHYGDKIFHSILQQNTVEA